MKSFPVNANPKVIQYYMEAYNISLEELAKKINAKNSSIDGIVKGTIKLRYVQLQKMAKMVEKDPLIFMLDKPPEDKPLSNVFRKLINSEHLTYKIMVKINRIKELQEVANELYNNIEKSIEPIIDEYSIKRDPAEVAAIERKKFYSYDEQKSWKKPYESFNKWRSALENKNMLVMQIPVDTEYFRGFSLIDSKPFIIVVNSKDDINARSFTLFHEYAHLLLRNIETGELNNEIEKWCNEFASNFLLSSDVLDYYTNKINDIDKLVKTISSKYKVSYSMIYYRLYSIRRINKDTYNAYISECSNSSKIVKGSKARVGGPPQEVLKKSAYGIPFLRAVIENYEKGNITIEQALNYLSTTYNTFKKLEESV
ncbi:XRE family transcriptional regulator [Ferroplasma sp.]|uniref:ImmA/IrrE family metallo-endopeptidase n=1 Tax=Ferroplasma sp. TaxID=2591003 RepID=UPI00307E83EE